MAGPPPSPPPFFFVLLLPSLLLLFVMGAGATPVDEVTAHVVNALLEQSTDKNLMVNVVAESPKEMPPELSKTLQVHVGIPTSEFTEMHPFWVLLRERRKRWLGSVNVLCSTKRKFIWNYFDTLKERFFTGNDLGIANERRMDLIFRNVFHVFQFDDEYEWHSMKVSFEAELEESMNVLVLVKEGNETAVLWNKVDPSGRNKLEQVNRWLPQEDGFKNRDRLYPDVDEVYSDMMGREFAHPVMHKPPWNYVTRDRSGQFLEDNGGRDVTLTAILAEKLNFSYYSVDPLDYEIRRSRGSSWKKPNYTMNGINGKIHRREHPFHFYLGDTTQTYTRNSAVEFTFFTLADAGAFVTPAPKEVYPPGLVYKPFTYTVWAVIGVTVAIVMVAGFLVFELTKWLYPTYMGPIRNRAEADKLYSIGSTNGFYKMYDAIIRIVSAEDEQYFIHGHDIPMTLGIRGILGTMMSMWHWVIFPSYAGALISFYSLPMYAPTLDTLDDLHREMLITPQTLGVTEGSSSFGVLATGGGIYNKIWTEMQNKDNWRIDSVGKGLDQVENDPFFAVFAGREKLVFDTIRRGGSEKFHINAQVFFTKYKAVVVRNGSPLRNNFDKVLMRVFEAGLLQKITQDEYNGITKRIGKHGWRWNKWYSEGKKKNGGDKAAMTNGEEAAEEETARILRNDMLIGGYILIVVGLGLATAVFAMEWCSESRNRKSMRESVASQASVAKVESASLFGFLWEVTKRMLCPDPNNNHGRQQQSSRPSEVTLVKPFDEAEEDNLAFHA